MRMAEPRRTVQDVTRTRRTPAHNSYDTCRPSPRRGPSANPTLFIDDPCRDRVCAEVDSLGSRAGIGRIASGPLTIPRLVRLMVGASSTSRAGRPFSSHSPLQWSSPPMTTWKWLAAGLSLVCTTSLCTGPPPAEPGRAGQDAVPASAPADMTAKAAPSRVTAVTVYQGNALVTREVEVPRGQGAGRDRRHAPARPDGRQLALRRGNRRRPRPQHALPHPRRQGGHPQGGPRQGNADPHPQAGGRADAEGDSGHRAEPPVAHQAGELHRRDHAATGREGALEQRGDPGPGQVRHGRRAPRSRRRRSPCSRNCRPTPRRPSSPPASWASSPPGRAGPSATR